MIKFPLKKKKRFSEKMFQWSSCAPFVENSRGALIHRPRSVATFNIFKTPHIAAGYWCGAVATGGKNLKFVETLSEGSVLCARCEEMAVSHGLPSADDIVGHHVCKERARPIKPCGCDQ